MRRIPQFIEKPGPRFESRAFVNSRPWVLNSPYSAEEAYSKG